MNRVCAMECPGCGAPVELHDKVCQYCSRPVIITTFNSVYEMDLIDVKKQVAGYRKAFAQNPDDKSVNLSAAFCYLKLKLYDDALRCFEKAIEDNFDNSEAYFYAAVTLLNGKRPFLALKKQIEKAEEYLDAAIAIEPRGIYYYFLAYIRLDYYSRKFLKASPSYKELLLQANSVGFSSVDEEMLFRILCVEKPLEL